MRPWLIIFNPNAGMGRAQKYLNLIRDDLNHRGIAHQIKITEFSGHARQWLQGADLTDYGSVIAAGGDGTIFEVVNGLMQHKESTRPPLGVIPVGTGNAFARELGLLATDWRKGLDIVLAQQTQPIDIGSAQTNEETLYFINIIGMGFVVDAGKTTYKIKSIGRSAYTLATLWETAKLKKYPVQVSMINHKNQTIELNEDLVFVEVANSRYTGTSFLIAPDAQIDDGLLDVIILKKISRPKILSLFPSIYSGKHVNYKEVETHQVKNIRIETENPMPLMPDGEFTGQTPVTIQCLPKALNLFVNH